MAIKGRMIGFRADDDLAEMIEMRAAREGLTASAFLRSLAERSEPVDAEDAELLKRLAEGEDRAAAVADLLGLNVVSLVHRACLGCEAADGLVYAYARLADPDGKERLCLALIAAVDRLRHNDPSVDEIAALAETGRRYLERPWLRACMEAAK